MTYTLRLESMASPNARSSQAQPRYVQWAQATTVRKEGNEGVDTTAANFAAPFAVGRSEDVVHPATTILFKLSIPIAVILSCELPPKYPLKSLEGSITSERA